MKRVRWLALWVGLLCVTEATHVAATPEYPLVIDSVLEISPGCPRPNSRCLICHTTARGGQGTAVQGFARTLKTKYGLMRGRDPEGLQNALLGLSSAAEPDDSDDDGFSDEDELRLCGNPSGADLGIGPEYGCDGAHLARDVGTDVPFVLVAVTVAVFLVRPFTGRAPTSRRDPRGR